MKVANTSIILLALLSCCIAITITENASPSENPTSSVVEVESRSKTQKRESSDQTASEDKTRSIFNNEPKFNNQQNFKEQTNQIQYDTSPFIPTNGQHYSSAATPQVQYVKPTTNQIDYNKLESPSSTVQYTQHYRNVPATYQTLSYSGYHPSHAKLAAIQYVTAPVSSPTPVHYASDYIGHASVPAIQYAAVALPVTADGTRPQHPVQYASDPNTYLNYGHNHPSGAQVQLAYAVHIPQQVQQYLKQAMPGIQYAATAAQVPAVHAAPGPTMTSSVQATPASTNQHYFVAAAPAAAAPAPHGFMYSKSQPQAQQLYYAVVPNYHQGYHQGQGAYAIAVQRQQPAAFQLQASKQHVLTTNSINAGPVGPTHVQISQAPAILYKQQQHYIPAVVTAPSPTSAAPHNSPTSYATYSALIPTPTPTAAAVIAQQYKAVAPIAAVSTTIKPPTIYATTTTASSAPSGVFYQHPVGNYQKQQVQHQHQPRFIYASAAQPVPVYAQHPSNIHYGTHLYHPFIPRGIISPTPPPNFQGK